MQPWREKGLALSDGFRNGPFFLFKKMAVLRESRSLNFGISLIVALRQYNIRRDDRSYADGFPLYVNAKATVAQNNRIF